MSLRCKPLDVPLKESKSVDDNRVIYFFQKDQQAKILVENLAEMQANGGLMTDVTLCTKSGKDQVSSFHSMLLAACSPSIKQHLKRGVNGEIVLKEMTEENLQSFRDFLYMSKVTLFKKNVGALEEFAKRYNISSLRQLCETFKDQLKDDEEVRVLWGDYKHVLSEIYDMFINEEFTTLLLEDAKGRSQFAVHGALIAAASPVLQKLLTYDLQAQGGIKYRLSIPSSILRDLIRYIYSAQVILDSENVIGLLKAAAAYELPALVRVCCDWLISRLNGGDDAVDNLGLVREVDSDQTGDLKEASKRYILVNFTEMCKGDELSELYYEDLLEILSDKELNVQHEEDVFFAVIKWVEASEIDRLPSLCHLLKCVHLEFTSRAFLDQLEQDSRIGNCSQCIEVIRKARKGLITDKRTRKINTTQDEMSEVFDQRVETFLADLRGHGIHEQMLFAKENMSRDKNEDWESKSSSTKSIDPYASETTSQLNHMLRKDGRPDKRYEQNRNLYLKKGKNKNGTVETRLTENRDLEGKPKMKVMGETECTVPMHKDETPDMRYKVNKEEAFGSCRPRRNKTDFSQQTSEPFRNNGKPDTRFKTKKEARKVESSAIKRRTGGTPDMRFNINNRLHGPRMIDGVADAGLLKKDGTSDVRYVSNRHNDQA